MSHTLLDDQLRSSVSELENGALFLSEEEFLTKPQACPHKSDDSSKASARSASPSNDHNVSLEVKVDFTSAFSWSKFLLEECKIPEEDLTELVAALVREKYTEEDLPMIDKDDLKEMGFPGGHRKKFLKGASLVARKSSPSAGRPYRNNEGPSKGWQTPRSAIRERAQSVADRGLMHTHQFNSESALEIMKAGQPFVQHSLDENNQLRCEEVSLHFDELKTGRGVLWWGSREYDSFRTPRSVEHTIFLDQLVELKLGTDERMMFQTFGVEEENLINCVSIQTVDKVAETRSRFFWFEAPNVFVLNCYLIGISSWVTGQKVHHTDAYTK